MRKLVKEIDNELIKLNINLEPDSIDSMITKMRTYIKRSGFRLSHFKTSEQNELVKTMLLMKYKSNIPMVKSYAPDRKDPSNKLKDKESRDNYDFNKKMFYSLNKVTVNSDISNLKNMFLKHKVHFDENGNMKHIRGLFNINIFEIRNIIKTETIKKLKSRLSGYLRGLDIQIQTLKNQKPLFMHSYTTFYFEKFLNELIMELYTSRVLELCDQQPDLHRDILDFINNIEIKGKEEALNITYEYFYHLVMLEKRNEYESLINIRNEQIKKRNMLDDVPDKYLVTEQDINKVDKLKVRKIILEKEVYDEQYNKHFEESTVLLNFLNEYDEVIDLGQFGALQNVGFNSGNFIQVKSTFRTVFRSDFYYTLGTKKKDAKYDENKRKAKNIARQIFKLLKKEASITKYNKQDILFLKEIITKGEMRELQYNHRYILRCEFKNVFDKKVLSYSKKLGLNDFDGLKTSIHFKVLNYLVDLLENKELIHTYK